MQAQEVQHLMPQDAIGVQFASRLRKVPSLPALALGTLAAIAVTGRAIAPNLPADGAR